MTNYRDAILRPARMVLDVLTVALSFVVAHYLRGALLGVYPFGLAFPLETYWAVLLGVSMLWVWLLARFGSYERIVVDSISGEMARLARVVVLGLLIVLAVGFAFRILFIARSLILIFVPVSYGCLLLQRFLLQWWFGQMKRRGYYREATLVVGTGPLAQQFCRQSLDRSEWGVHIIGFVGRADPKIQGEDLGARVLGTYGDFQKVIHDLEVDQVVVAVPIEQLAEVRDILAVCDEAGIRVLLISDWLHSLWSRASLSHFHGSWGVIFFPPPSKEWQLFLKRLMDIIGSGLGLILLSPLFLAIALAIKLTSEGPVFYKWRVVGLNRRPFVSYKFRTMVLNADELKSALEAENEMKGPVFKIKHDPRVTRLGRFLRKYSLDELPQLWSVLNGDMSLVGPRPPLVTEVRQFDTWHRRKLSIRPGITCLWQIKGRSEITDFNEWARLDLQYIDQWSLWLDVKILLRTIPTVLLGRGAS